MPRTAPIVGYAETLERLIIQRRKTLALPAEHPEMGINHLKWMCRQVYNGQVSGQRAARWIGYVEGVLLGAGGTTLDELVAMTGRVYRE